VLLCICNTKLINREGAINVVTPLRPSVCPSLSGSLRSALLLVTPDGVRPTLKSSFANSSKAVKNNGATAAVAAECLVHFRKLLLSCYKVFDFRNIRETEGDRKVLVSNPYSS
jgi:hypothetical protein